MSPTPPRASFSAPPSYPSLQVSRGVAAALVVLFHLGGTFAQEKYFGFKALDGPFAWGDAGVDFFFVLSGFLITTVHRHDFGHPRALPGYLRKRATRIYPTYWLVCGIVFAGGWLIPSFRQSLPGDAVTWFKTLALLPQDPGVVGGVGAPILFVAWSLQYELMFYGVVAFFIINRAVGAALVAAMAIAVAVALATSGPACVWGSGCAFPLSFIASPMVVLFAIGAAGAYFVASPLHMPRPELVALVGIISFIALGVFEQRFGRDLPGFDRRLGYGLISGMIIVSLARADRSQVQGNKRPGLTLFGESSYALYLLHIPIISLLCKLLVRAGVSGPLMTLLSFIAVFVACVVAAVAFHVAIERPMLRWLRTFSFRRPQEAAQRSPAGPEAAAR